MVVFARRGREPASTRGIGSEAVKLEIDIFTDQAEAVIQMELEEHEKDQSDGDESDHGADGSA